MPRIHVGYHDYGSRADGGYDRRPRGAGSDVRERERRQESTMMTAPSQRGQRAVTSKKPTANLVHGSGIKRRRIRTGSDDIFCSNILSLCVCRSSLGWGGRRQRIRQNALSNAEVGPHAWKLLFSLKVAARRKDVTSRQGPGTKHRIGLASGYRNLQHGSGGFLYREDTPRKTPCVHEK